MRNVHIVDDDEPFRNSLRILLSVQPNLVIRCFRSGDAFLEQSGEIEPGVLLLDHDMPGASGMHVLDAIRAENGKYATIMLTGYADVALAVQAMKAGASDFIEKPFDPVMLLRTMEDAFARLERADAASRRAGQAKARIGSLSPREADVLRGVIKGSLNKAIASELELSPRTVEIHRANMMDKLAVGNVSEALRVAYAAGLFDGEDEAA